MSGSYNALVGATPVALMPGQNRTATFTGIGQDVSSFEGHAIAILDASPVSGTTPTLDAKLQECDTLNGTYTDVAGGGFAQVTTGAAVIQKLAFEISAVKKFLRVLVTLAGTSPVYNGSVILAAQKKY
jgi:hypothetical protein